MSFITAVARARAVLGLRLAAAPPHCVRSSLRAPAAPLARCLSVRYAASQLGQLDEECWAARQRQSFGVTESDYPDENTSMGTMAKHFPGALPGQIVDLVTHQVLQSHGFDRSNTLFAHATCPDEINANNTSDDLVVLLRRRWRGAFPLGGLAGIPFVGETGWAAFSAHVPEDGRIFLLFAPHVGCSASGVVGKVGRRGQSGDSTACGAAVAALAACNSGAEVRTDPYDYQQSYITTKMKDRADEINSAGCPNAALVHAIYDVQVEFLRKMVRASRSIFPIAVLGGIQINTPDEEPDHFMPLMFELHTPKDTTTSWHMADQHEAWSVTDVLRALTSNLPGMGHHEGFKSLSWSTP